MRKFVLAAVLVLVAGGAQAVALNVVGGQLLGAYGVDVGGTLYDVTFANGTCSSLFAGCDDVSDFTFNGQASGFSAAEALVGQVFLDGPSGAFNTQPELTAGCGLPVQCTIYTPYGFTPPLGGSPEVLSAGALNNPSISGLPPTIATGDQSLSSNYAYALWTPVPEPSTALLVGIGLAGIAARRRPAAR